MEQQLEGWFTDPFGRHEARWFSAGTPTNLVRDGSTESHDDPPDEPPTHVPERLAPPGGPDTLRRSDDAEREDYSRERIIDAGETGSGGAPV
jgi:hypothetical protein